MNCKPGDLAVIVRSRMGNEGALLRVLDTLYAEPGEWRCEAFSRVKDNWGDFRQPGEVGYANDCDLRPLRDPGITTEEVKELFSPSPAKESEKV